LIFKAKASQNQVAIFILTTANDLKSVVFFLKEALEANV
jgi:hypothetical protein